MSLKDIEGNQRVIKRMIMAVKNSNISHAYILEGDSNINKVEIAKNFVKAILCEKQGKEVGDCCETCISCKKINHGNHEDIFFLISEGNSIKDEAIEELQSRIKKKPYAGDRNVVIIQDADMMTLRAQNRLLKTLEEPASGTVIILLSENIENLTQTILSRCVVYKLNTLYSHNYERTLEGAIIVADMLLEGRSFYVISNKITEFTTTKEMAYEFLNALESWYRDLAISEYDQVGNIVFNVDKLVEIERKSRLYKKTAIYRAIECIEDTKSDLNRNINISYSLKSMILKIIA